MPRSMPPDWRRRPARTAAGLALAATAAGCAGQGPDAQTLPVSTPAAVAVPASSGADYVLDSSAARTVCAGPGPDATHDRAAAGKLSLSLVDLGGDRGKTADAATSEELEMLGRTPAVLLARTLMFRLCLASHNHQLAPETVADLYKRNLKVIRAVATREAGNTTVSETMKLTDGQTVTPSVPQPATPKTHSPAGPGDQ